MNSMTYGDCSVGRVRLGVRCRQCLAPGKTFCSVASDSVRHTEDMPTWLRPGLACNLISDDVFRHMPYNHNIAATLYPKVFLDLDDLPGECRLNVHVELDVGRLGRRRLLVSREL